MQHPTVMNIVVNSFYNNYCDVTIINYDGPVVQIKYKIDELWNMYENYHVFSFADYLHISIIKKKINIT
jgi:hypothetical protein